MIWKNAGWQWGVRLGQASAMSMAALCIALIAAAVSFFLIMVGLASTTTMHGSEDFVLVLFNTVPVALLAACWSCVALLRPDAIAAMRLMVPVLAGSLAVLLGLGLAHIGVTRDDNMYTAQDAAYLGGAFIPAFVAVAVLWLSVRAFLWALGKRGL